MNNYPEVNDIVGKYKILSLLGKGATACVYKAYHNILKTDVALKVLSSALVQKNKHAEEIFFDEAVNLAMMSHPGLIKIMDAEITDKYSYIVMEYIQGKTLEGIIQQFKKIEPVSAIKIMIKVCLTLDYAASFKLVHRDIKPGNIMVNSKSEVKILDFGLSKVINQPIKYPTVIGGPMCGSIYYMAPEQLTDSERVDHRADIYSIGATLYHMVTGQMPFSSENLSELMMMQISETPKEPVYIESKINHKFSDLIMKMLEKSPNRRFQNYEELIKAFEDVEKTYELEQKQIISENILVKEIKKAEHNISHGFVEEDSGNDLQAKFFRALKKKTGDDSEIPIYTPKVINQDTLPLSQDYNPNKNTFQEEEGSTTNLSDLQMKFLKNITNL